MTLSGKVTSSEKRRQSVSLSVFRGALAALISVSWLCGRTSRCRSAELNSSAVLGLAVRRRSQDDVERAAQKRELAPEDEMSRSMRRRNDSSDSTGSSSGSSCSTDRDPEVVAPRPADSADSAEMTDAARTTASPAATPVPTRGAPDTVVGGAASAGWGNSFFFHFCQGVPRSVKFAHRSIQTRREFACEFVEKLRKKLR